MTHVSGNRFALKNCGSTAMRSVMSRSRSLSPTASSTFWRHSRPNRRRRTALCAMKKGWRVFITTDVMPTPTCSDVRLGVIGVDFNVGFVSVSETDRFGNIIANQDLPMVTAGLSKHATQTVISIAVQEIIAITCKAQKPISIEFLDFAKKKARLSYASPSRQRILSAFAYTRFAQTVSARAHDAGIEVVEAQAAYSSKIGAQKYARRYGLSVHRAAAFVLARRGQKLPDRLKPSSRKRFAATCKDRGEPVLGRLKATSDRGKARLETYARPSVRAILAAPRHRKRSETETSDVPRCNSAGVISTPYARSGVDVRDFSAARNGCL
jgi:hypothetical protein